jgi:hypothetical protein
MVGVMIPGLGRAAEPCPPPQISLSGGTTATTNCTIVSGGSSYSTNFELTENPISEGGKWVNGQSVGQQWSNVQTASGNAYGSRFVDSGGACRYCDPIAHLSTSFMTFSANQYAQGVVHRAAGYSHVSPPNHEVELLLRFQITPNSARGYEILISRDDWIIIVRWNGPVGNYTELASTGGPISPVVADGDLIRAEIGSDNRVRVYKNGVLKLTGPADATFATGQPGIGFWPIPGSTLSSYGWKSFTAGNL